jgi:hypothetical protein
MKKFFALVVSISLFGSLFVIPAFGAVKAGAACTKVGSTSTTSGKKFTCIKSGKRLVWNKGNQVAKTSPEIKYSNYEMTKLKAYKNIREGANNGSLENISLVYHVSKDFPKDLLELYKTQVEYSSKLYGSFFKKKEVMNIYLYTEKDEEFLYSQKLFIQGMPDFVPWFEAWRNGKYQQHNLGLIAQYAEYPTQGNWEGHAGILVYSGANSSSLQNYSIQVMPHEYWHVVQDYYFRPKWEEYWQNSPNKSLDGQDFYSLSFPTTFREGSANTISFAIATKTPKEYLNLYSEFIREKKTQSEVKLFGTLTSIAAVESALKKIENRRLFSEAHESSYSIGSLLYEWVIAEYGFDAYRRLIENQLIGNSFEDNVKTSLGISVDQMYKGAAPHILAAFSQK